MVVADVLSTLVVDRWEQKQKDMLILANLNRQTNLNSTQIETFTRCVSPWFIVGGEHSKVTATNKVLIVHWQQRTCGRQELRVENYLGGHFQKKITS